MKQCSTCHDTKPLSDYYNKGASKKQSMCKYCFNKYCMERWRQKKLEAIKYLGGKCIDCNTVFHYSVFEFHHLRDKDVNWTKLRLRSPDKIKHELDKCVLLCANCHRLRHYED